MLIRFQKYDAYMPWQPSFQHYLITVSTIKKMIMQILKLLSLIIVLLALPQVAWAQTTKNDTIPFASTWEVGFDLLSLFNKGNVNTPKASIFFRRNYAISNQWCKALRLRVGLDSEKREGYAFDGVLTGKLTTYAPYLSIGHEWKQNFKRYSWYIATDISGMYLHTDHYYLVSGDNFYYDKNIRDLDIAINGLLGYQIKLSKSLLIGIESVFVVKLSDHHIDFISNDRTVFGGDDYFQFTTSIQPFMAVNLIYTLQNHKKNVKK